MKKNTKFQLNFIDILLKRLKSPSPLIQVILGPRQVGKTTGILQLIQNFSGPSHYVSADDEITPGETWVLEHWQKAMLKGKKTLLVIDEIPKVQNWSEVIKRLWDKQVREKKTHLKIVLLGSSSLLLQKGLSESLAGRFEMIPVYHWNFTESKKRFGFKLDDYLNFGGYPGSYAFTQQEKRWKTYMQQSIVDPVISKDILMFNQVRSPALFRQAFEIVCSYPAQEISYNKLLGQLQDKGNTDLIKHYLELFSGAFLIKTLFKFSAKATLSKSSSPKILLGCPALSTRQEWIADQNSRYGRLFELAVGMELIRLEGELSYWREANREVDYILQYQKKLFAIEVKSGRKKRTSGLSVFLKKYSRAIPIIIDSENFEKFSQSPQNFLSMF